MALELTIVSAAGPGDEVDPKPLRRHVEVAVSIGEFSFVSGWSLDGPPHRALRGGASRHIAIASTDRPDVAAHFKLESTTDLGFALLVAADEGDSLVLEWAQSDSDDDTHEFVEIPRTTAASTLSKTPSLAAGALRLLASLEVGSDAWQSLLPAAPKVSSIPSASPCAGHLELAMRSQVTSHAIVVGWSISGSKVPLWLEVESGAMTFIEPERRWFRADVATAVGSLDADANSDAGFATIVDVPTTRSSIHLRALTSTGVVTLHSISCGDLPADPVKAAEFLSGIRTPRSSLTARIENVDLALLTPLREKQVAKWPRRLSVDRTFGRIPQTPSCSVVVPLYGRIDFLEHQLAEFDRSESYRASVETIFVVDDPQLVEPVQDELAFLTRLYRVSCRVVFGGVNRGFAGACNLGASVASAPTLIFLNSDAFPSTTDWHERLLEVLLGDAGIGAVGARLLYGNGSIQHAGMAFKYNESLCVWLNEHPLRGFAPSLDRSTSPREVPAVTGACVAIRAADFRSVGGFDTGFLVGDFEDSDLCLKLREKGLRSVYVPDVSLTHLERQSLQLSGSVDGRQYLVLFNAARHQARWRTQLAKMGTPRHG